MADLIFYGASDDLIEIDGALREEFYGEDAEFLVQTDSLDEPRRAFVRVRFEKDGNWSVAIRPADENVRSYDGKVDVSPAMDYEAGHAPYRAYSARLTLDVPDNTTVTIKSSDGEAVTAEED